MYYVYVLKNAIGKLYYGYTNDLRRRLEEHQRNDNWKLIYYEAYLSEKDARNREMKLKKFGQSIKHLRNRIPYSLMA